MNRKQMIAAVAAVALMTTVGWSQQKAPTEPQAQKAPAATAGPKSRLTDEQKAELMQHWKMKPEQTWEEFIADWLTPKPFSKKYAAKINDKYAYPHLAASVKMEIVREDEDTVWLRGIPPENPESPLYPIWAQSQANEALYLDQIEAMQTPGAIYFMDFKAEELPPPFQNALDFEAVAGELPTGGRWQMGFATADMNGDGNLDLVFPPTRKGFTGRPSIFLGDGNGAFVPWKDVTWPGNNVSLDYGGVDVGDLDGDGNLDIVLAIHFSSQYVLHGDGKGDFSRVERLPSPDPRLSSRAVTINDFNGDGRLDLAFAAEIDFDVKTSAAIEGSKCVWVLQNTTDGWVVQTEGLPDRLIADVIHSKDMNQDGRPDLIVASNSSGERRLIYLNKGDEGWEQAVFNGVLSAAYHYDVEPVGDEVFATFIQFNMIESKAQARNGLVRYPMSYSQEVWKNGTVLVWDKERVAVYFRLGAGDLNGDGLADIVAGRKTGGLEAFLQNEDGEFSKELAPELAETGVAYDIKLVDLNGDGLDDIVAGFAPAGGWSGGVRVWLTQPRG
jgi:hypothetical protein